MSNCKKNKLGLRLFRKPDLFLESNSAFSYHVKCACCRTFAPTGEFFQFGKVHIQVALLQLN